MTEVKLTNIETKTYEYKDGFMIDIQYENDVWDAFLYHRDYGVKDLMFGLPKQPMSENLEEVLEIVEANLENESYIEFYTENYMDEY